jgi:hypothetical protein
MRDLGPLGQLVATPIPRIVTIEGTTTGSDLTARLVADNPGGLVRPGLVALKALTQYQALLAVV